MYDCKVCKKSIFAHHNALTNHLKTHNLNSKEYYDKYLKSSTDGHCLGCGASTKYANFKQGYLKFCSKKCASKVNVSNHWKDADERRNILSERMKGNTWGGRPKGSKNKNPYPRTPAVIERLAKSHPPSWKGKHRSDETKEKMSIARSAHIAEHGLQMSYKGRFIPKNPNKYKGLLTDPKTGLSAIVWRSTWELRVFNYLDTQPAVLEWSSEEISIPYISPLDDRMHRYYPDVYVKKKMLDGKIVKQLIEIKPAYQCSPPKMQKKLTPKYITEVKTWGVNDAKWKAAQRFCDEYGWEFVKITEHDLGIMPK